MSLSPTAARQARDGDRRSASRQGGGDPARSGRHSHSIHRRDIDLIFISHPSYFPDRISIVRKRYRPDAAGIVQVDVPPGSGTAIENFMHVVHNLPGVTPRRAPQPKLDVLAEDTAVAGVYTASFWETTRRFTHRTPTDRRAHGVTTPVGGPSSRSQAMRTRAQPPLSSIVTRSVAPGKRMICGTPWSSPRQAPMARLTPS
jgi:hypothetical protein